MKLSVVVTFYNCEAYVESCLDSVLEQDYEDFEVIVVDDGSTDQTRAKLQPYIDRGVVRHRDLEHQGVSVARNAGIEMAQGAYIMFVDGDDQLSPSILSVLADALHDEVDIVACTCTAFDGKDYEYQCHFFKGDRTVRTMTEKEDLFAQLILVPYGQEGYKAHTAIGVPWGKLYRRNFLLEHDLRFERDLIRMQDNIFNMNAFYAARCIEYLDQPLYRYRLAHIRSYKMDPEINYRVLSRRDDFFKAHPETETAKLRSMFMQEIMNFLFRAVRWFAENEAYAEFMTDLDLWRSKPLCEEAVGTVLPLRFKKKVQQLLLKTRSYKILHLMFKQKH